MQNKQTKVPIDGEWYYSNLWIMAFGLHFKKWTSPFLDGHFLTYKVIYIQDVASRTILQLLHHIINVIIYIEINSHLQGH
jgi:hypothetical protein